MRNMVSNTEQASKIRFSKDISAQDSARPEKKKIPLAKSKIWELGSSSTEAANKRQGAISNNVCLKNALNQEEKCYGLPGQQYVNIIAQKTGRNTISSSTEGVGTAVDRLYSNINFSLSWDTYTRCGYVCNIGKQKSTEICELKTCSNSSSHRCTQSYIEQMEEPILLPTMEFDSESSLKGCREKFMVTLITPWWKSATWYSYLIKILLSKQIPITSTEIVPDPSSGKSIMTKGLEDSEIKLMLDNPFTVKKNKFYSHAQNMFIKRRTKKDMNNYNITPIEMVNFLENGQNKYKWVTATIFSYRAAILSLCRDNNIIISNSGENKILTPEQLIKKFMLVDGNIPKEKHSGSSIEKVCYIHKHSAEYLCPVKTYKDYKKRVAVLSCEGLHPINSSLTIGKHINSLMKLISIDKGSKVPKAKALGSTIATTAGATYYDVIAQEF
ncbi:hypothetical protein BB561_006032 [Smittium simulii]|uniref:Uncharacterized protein n=1 Tax=Smittium simulii TaxID=133385 RepID=A0A2T9Y6X4_9FUNG|nr:hypothetical protein BB561_006032 [Smittium simulii]